MPYAHISAKSTQSRHRHKPAVKKNVTYGYCHSGRDLPDSNSDMPAWNRYLLYHYLVTVYFNVATISTGLLSSVSFAAASFIFAELLFCAYEIKSVASSIWYILPSLA